METNFVINSTHSGDMQRARHTDKLKKNEEEKTRCWGGRDMTGGWIEVGQKERLRREREEVKGK